LSAVESEESVAKYGDLECAFFALNSFSSNPPISSLEAAFTDLPLSKGLFSGVSFCLGATSAVTPAVLKRPFESLLCRIAFRDLLLGLDALVSPGFDISCAEDIG
jgi:hypothetical protein